MTGNGKYLNLLNLLGKIREMTLRIFGQILAKILFCLQQFDKSLNMKGKQSQETEIM